MPEKKDRGAPDAVLYPDNMKFGRSSLGRLQGVQDRIGPILAGSDADYKGFSSHAIYTRDVGGGFWIATLSADHHATSLLYPQDHPTRPKQPRYDWVEQDDGTRHGWLKPDEPEEDEPAPKAIKKRKAEHPPAHAEPATRPNPEDNRP